MSAEDIAVFAFLRFLRDGDLTGSSQVGLASERPMPYRLGRLLEARQIAAAGRRNGYFGHERLVTRWLERTWDTALAGLEILPADARARLPVLLTNEELLERSAFAEAGPTDQQHFQRMLLSRSLIEADQGASGLISRLIFDDDEAWGLTLSDLHDAYTEPEANLWLIDSLVTLPQLAQELLNTEGVTDEDEVPWAALDGDDSRGRRTSNTLADDPEVVREAARWLQRLPAEPVSGRRPSPGEWRHKRPAVEILRRFVAYGVSVWATAPRRVAVETDDTWWADGEAASLAQYAQQTLPFLEQRPVYWPLLAWRVGPYDPRSVRRLETMLATVMPVLQFYPRRVGR